jgi:uncharacterized protein (DUF1330 family)
MTEGYWIAIYHAVSEPSALARYAAAATPVLLAHGARFLARGRPTRTFEGGADERCVVMSSLASHGRLRLTKAPSTRWCSPSCGTP